MIKELNLEEVNNPGEATLKAFSILNQLVNAVNTIQKEREAERFEIQEWISLLEAVRKSVNIHEKQIDELQMKLEPEKCEPAENAYTKTCRMDKEFAEGECVRLQNELERTRWALDVAVNMLKEIDKTRCGVDVKLYAVNHKSLNAGNVFCWTTPDEIHNVLEQITALEQKE